MSNEDTSHPQLPTSYDAAFKELEDLSARATKGDINIDELSTAIQRGNQLFAFLSSGIAKIKAEIETTLRTVSPNPSPVNRLASDVPWTMSPFRRGLTQSCRNTITLTRSRSIRLWIS